MHDPLRALARLYGIQLSYADIHGVVHHAAPDILLAMLRALGADIEHAGDATTAVARRRQELLASMAPPCMVAWTDQTTTLPIQVAGDGNAVELTIDVEGGAPVERRFAHGELDVTRIRVGDALLRRAHLPLPSLPPGYHRARVTVGANHAETLILSAPRLLPQPSSNTWGVFAPLYALRSERPTGGASLSELGELGKWVSSVGGGVVATLPLLASFTVERTEASPYRPVSRRYWNELYVDIERLPALDECAPARELLGSAEFRHSAERLAASSHVDYASLMGHRRRILSRMAAHAWTTPALRRELDAFVAQRPELLDYARFRAATAAWDEGWQCWQEPARAGDLSAAELDELDIAYHVYAQWQFHEQMSTTAAIAREHGPGLYLDLPVGVHPDGFDTWRDRDQLCLELEAGAPPDDLNSGGQCWALPVLHPQNSRAAGHAHVRESVRAHLRYAGVLRIDHVMGLRRLFCIPRGASAANGVYLRYPSEELFATVAIEASRAGAIVVGEDLGTVPDSVRREMSEHGARGMFVGQFSFGGSMGSTMHRPPKGTVASFGTHDTATFAGHARGLDIEIQEQLGLIDADAKQHALAGRRDLMTYLARHFRVGPELDADALTAIHDGLLSEMSESEAWMVLVTLEDLWLEAEPQNVPGTGPERDNWKRKLARTVEAIRTDRGLGDRLRRIFVHRSSAT